MGRWKSGPSGLYYDANDSGPDQGTPTAADLSKYGMGGAPTPTIPSAPSPSPSTPSPTPWAPSGGSDWPTTYLPTPDNSNNPYGSGNFWTPPGGYSAPSGGYSAPSFGGAPTGYGAADPYNKKGTIANWYKKYLGREGSDQEYSHWMNQPGDISKYEWNIANSPEAKAYAAKASTAPAAGTAPATGGSDPAGFGKAWMASGGRTVADLTAFVAANPQYGAKLVGSKNDKVQFADGSTFDAVLSAGMGGLGPSWQPLGAGGGSAFTGMFSDPATAKYEALLNAMIANYEGQQGAMANAAKLATDKRKTADDAVKKLSDFINSRVTTLTGPAYAGSEAEVLKTRALDPFESDRQAAKQRALLEISRRGLDPSSGIAQQLLNDIDRSYDQNRSHLQGELAFRTIEEERSRQQEAQQLLMYLAQLPDAVARGDLDFINYVNTLVNKPGQEGLAVGALLADLPAMRTELGLKVLGMGGSPMSAFGGASSLLANSQAQSYLDQQNKASYLAGLGKMIGYTFGL